MRRLLGIVLILAYLGGAVYFNLLQAAEWVGEKPRPLIRWLEKLDDELPADARILVAAPHDRLTLGHYRVQTWLHPRAVYPLPPKVKSVDEASDWIARKSITWIVFIGEEHFDPAQAYARRVGDDR
jgi:hypothetical protein